MKERARKIVFGVTLIVSIVAIGITRFALAVPSNPVTLPNPISATSFTQVVGNITTFLIEIAIPLTAVMALVGGFQMITASGDPEKFSKGRKTLMYAAIGFAVVLLAGGVAQIIKNFLGVKS